MTGPISTDVWSSKLVQYLTGILSKYGWYFAAGFVAALIWELRSFLFRQLKKLWRVLADAYAGAWRFVLRPVLPQKESSRYELTE